MMATVRWCVLMTVTLNWLTITPLNAGPVSINPAISPFGRNIRPITCRSKTGQLGTCMFAMDCTRMNGQHLGTCIDRFYFGSCCAPSDAVPFHSTTTTEGFNGGNDIGFSTSSPLASMSPLTTLLMSVTSQHPNILNDLTSTTIASALPTFGLIETSAAPATTTVGSTTSGGPTLAEILALTPLLLANEFIPTTEAALTTLQASSQQPIGTDSPSSFSPVADSSPTTISATMTTDSPSSPLPVSDPSATNNTTTMTTTPAITTTPSITITPTITTTASTVPAPTTTAQMSTTVTSSPSTTVTSAQLVDLAEPALIQSGELTVIGSTSASTSPEEFSTTDIPQRQPQEDEITTLEPITDVPSTSTEPEVEPEVGPEVGPEVEPEVDAAVAPAVEPVVFETDIPSSTEELLESTTVGGIEEAVTDAEPDATETVQEEVVTLSNIVATPDTPVTTTTTALPTTDVVTNPPTSPTLTSISSVSVSDSTTVIITTASPGVELESIATGMPTESQPVESETSPLASSSSSPVTLVSSSTVIQEEPSTAVPETSTASTAAPETSAASTSAPETSAASTSAPETSAASTSAPGTSTASTSAPETSTASTSAPETSTVSTSAPETSTASTSAPGTSAASTESSVVEVTPEPVSNEPATTTVTVSTTLAELNDTLEGPTVQFQNYREVCGRPKYQYPSARIVGGTTTQYGQWPWQVSLRQWRTATFLHKCGAALLNENWAITAAHCVDNVQPDDLLLRMGEYDLATDEEEYPYIERKVQIVASHPQFDSRTFEYDLALLRFYDPVRFQPNIVPICLPPPNEVDFVGRTAFVTGWGRLYEDGPLPSKMQQVSVPVINNTDCENMYRRAGYVEHIPNIFICAGYADGKRDSCEGDSGGPMVIQEEQSWVLAGVISWGIGCAEANQPGVYTRISEFREWIDKIIVF